jgi:hypothetical protein
MGQGAAVGIDALGEGAPEQQIAALLFRPGEAWLRSGLVKRNLPGAVWHRGLRMSAPLGGSVGRLRTEANRRQFCGRRPVGQACRKEQDAAQQHGPDASSKEKLSAQKHFHECLKEG